MPADAAGPYQQRSTPQMVAASLTTFTLLEPGWGNISTRGVDAQLVQFHDDLLQTFRNGLPLHEAAAYALTSTELQRVHQERYKLIAQMLSLFGMIPKLEKQLEMRYGLQLSKPIL